MVKAAVILLALGIAGRIESTVAGATNQAFGFNASLISAKTSGYRGSVAAPTR